MGRDPKMTRHEIDQPGDPLQSIRDSLSHLRGLEA